MKKRKLKKSVKIILCGIFMGVIATATTIGLLAMNGSSIKVVNFVNQKKSDVEKWRKDNDIDVIGKKMTIAGAGGAATAIEIQAALDGVKEMSIFNIKDKFWANAEETVKKIRENTDCIVNLYDLDDKDKLREEIADSYLFAQATGVGMKPLEGQTVVPDETYFRPDLIVTDTVYAPRETETLRLAKKAGCKTMNGLGMMLFQGDAAFHLWTGKHMPIDHMKEVLDIKYD